MVLSNLDILSFMQKGKIKISPFERSQLGPASVDLTLSDDWYFFKKKYIGFNIDLAKLDFKTAHKKLKSNSITLAPGQMCLGKTAEKITLSSDIIGRLEGRSRYARMGLAIHVTSAIVQPGSNNHQVLEIVNLSPSPLTIHKGMRVSQIIFEKMSSSTSMPYRKFGKIAKRQ